jgi:hypothetical protein
MRTPILVVTALALGVASPVCQAADPPFVALTISSWEMPSGTATKTMLWPDGHVAISRPGHPSYAGQADAKQLSRVLEGFRKAAPKFSSNRSFAEPSGAGKAFVMWFSPNDVNLVGEQFVQGTLATHDAALDDLIDALGDLAAQVLRDPKNGSFDSLDLVIQATGDGKGPDAQRELSIDNRGRLTVTVGPVDPPSSHKVFLGKLSAEEHDSIIRKWEDALGNGSPPAMIEDPSGDPGAQGVRLSGQIGTIQIVHEGAYGSHPAFKPFVVELEHLGARVEADEFEAQGKTLQGKVTVSADKKTISIDTGSETLTVANDPGSEEWTSLVANDGKTVAANAGVGHGKVLILGPAVARTHGFAGSISR